MPQTFKNGITHIRLECFDCGKFLKYKPQNIETFKLWFGMHKGKELKDVPISYLNWYLENGTDKKVLKRIKLFLEII
tara:strand:+ start:636 stop:866 length:231 start_codon:yes stop_codon:yes gene_type:complete